MKSYKWEDYDYEKKETLAEGWYAILFGFEPSEGSFAQALYFDGNEFSESLPILHISSDIFPDEMSAEKWSEDNAPSH